jgi:hypothetical protein
MLSGSGVKPCTAVLQVLGLAGIDVTDADKVQLGGLVCALTLGPNHITIVDFSDNHIGKCFELSVGCVTFIFLVLMVIMVAAGTACMYTACKACVLYMCCCSCVVQHAAVTCHNSMLAKLDQSNSGA